MGDTPYNEIKVSTVDLEHNKFTADSTGKVAVRTILDVGDIQIGAVEIKDATTDNRVTVSSTGFLKVLDAIKSNFCPEVFDDIELVWDTNDNLTNIIYWNNGVAVVTLIVTVNANGLITHIKL